MGNGSPRQLYCGGWRAACVQRAARDNYQFVPDCARVRYAMPDLPPLDQPTLPVLPPADGAPCPPVALGVTTDGWHLGDATLAPSGPTVPLPELPGYELLGELGR